MILNNYYRLCTVVCILISAFTSMYGGEEKKSPYKSLSAIGKNPPTLYACLEDSESNKGKWPWPLDIIIEGIGEKNLNFPGPNRREIATDEETFIALTPAITSMNLAIIIGSEWNPTCPLTTSLPKTTLHNRIARLNSIFEAFGNTLASENELPFKNNTSSLSNKKTTLKNLKERANFDIVREGIALAVSETEKASRRIDSLLNKDAITKYCNKVCCREDRALLINYLAYMQLCYLQIEVPYLFTQDETENIQPQFHYAFHIYQRAYPLYREMVAILTQYWANAMGEDTHYNQSLVEQAQTNNQLQDILIKASEKKLRFNCHAIVVRNSKQSSYNRMIDLLSSPRQQS